MDVAQRKFFGFGSKRQTVRVQLRPDSELRLKLWELVKRHESEQRMVEGEIEETVDFDKQLIALTAYVARHSTAHRGVAGMVCKSPFNLPAGEIYC